jgi:hypothetical protein
MHDAVAMARTGGRGLPYDRNDIGVRDPANACRHCGALRWPQETDTICCHGGKVALHPFRMPDVQGALHAVTVASQAEAALEPERVNWVGWDDGATEEYRLAQRVTAAADKEYFAAQAATAVLELWTKEYPPDSVLFRISNLLKQFPRHTNSAFALASQPVNTAAVAPGGRWMPTFVMQGQVQQRIGPLIPSAVDGQPVPTPQFAQIYMLDGNHLHQQTDLRRANMSWGIPSGSPQDITLGLMLDLIRVRPVPALTPFCATFFSSFSSISLLFPVVSTGQPPHLQPVRVRLSAPG